MIEQRVIGREVTIGMLAGSPLGIVEVIPDGGVYDYKRKYSPGSTEYRFRRSTLKWSMENWRVCQALLFRMRMP